MRSPGVNPKRVANVGYHTKKGPVIAHRPLVFNDFSDQAFSVLPLMATYIIQPMTANRARTEMTL
jgi:hypothetical protein